MITQLIGYIASFVSIGMYFPQVVKSWRTKDLKGISFATFSLACLNSVLWTTYGILIGSIPVAFANFVLLILTAIILILKKKYS